MLVNSFDTKFAKTAEKYENLDNSFVNLLKKKNSFNRIFTSVVTNKKVSEEVILRSDITGQVLNSVMSREASSKQNLYYIELYVSRKSKSIFDLLYLLMGLTKTMNIEAE